MPGLKKGQIPGYRLTPADLSRGGSRTGITKAKGAHVRFHWEPLKKKMSCPYCRAEIAAQSC
jgi:hypothetical protein